MVNSALDPSPDGSNRDDVNLRIIPLSALKHETCKHLSAMLNKRKVFRTDDGYFRDWRGLFQVICLDNQYTSDLQNHANPTAHILHLWQKAGARARYEPNLWELQRILVLMARHDVWDDSEARINDDARSFLIAELNHVSQKQIVSCEKSDADILTRDDTSSHKQQYDAFILYADKDAEFASEIIERMEERNLKLCVKDRDILAGIEFEHDVFVRLISERCRRLIIVISEEFLKSPLNEYFVMFARALQIEQKKRKIIPCVYERMQLPSNLRYYFTLDYKRSNKLYNFWEKLEDALIDKSLRALPEVNLPASVTVPQIVNVPNDKADIVHEPLEQQPEETNTTSNNTVDIRKSSCNSEKMLTYSENNTKELCKKKWYSILGKSSAKVNLNRSKDKPDKKKKWYKSNKKMATAL
ncbi:myeloid differentiation primary response protein MyD88 [Toxorhynchites rutilus septentrionalis]|uniref:myeloid differentiation primary response protein MyD88 n=1 Tax=Toxorhynchites rutilus septentrionalis TaxID=329112 RepID=UPI002479705C|nr:myeloid differentiation primary response protein MyD88 [Toxorhynchites rutilus septentrionalis]